MKGWEVSIGMYPGLVLGVRSYKQQDRVDHVFYLPLFDLCITVFTKEKKE
ncbi:hypothetical protein H8D85_00405 [bacterium]|jgi:hypothetical protein|nr:hypothetical protein [bacterium]|tara:strand:+ start:156 stop:305 length:150 start_codon:yes stop_codon:yes gene_type:complete